MYGEFTRSLRPKEKLCSMVYYCVDFRARLWAVDPLPTAGRGSTASPWIYSAKYQTPTGFHTGEGQGMETNVHLYTDSSEAANLFGFRSDRMDSSLTLPVTGEV